MSTDFWNAVEDDIFESEIAHEQERRDLRMKRCRQDVSLKELPDGGRKMILWRCKDPRCDYCNGIRGLQMRNRVSAAIIAGFDIAALWMTKAQADKRCRRAGKDNYIRIPQSDDLDIIFVITDASNPEYGATPVDLKFITEFDWKECCRRKTPRIISGGLCKEAEKDEEGQYNFIGKEIVAGPKELVEKAYNQTCLEVVPWQQPETVQENQSVRNYFNGRLVSKIVELGGSVALILDKRVKSDSLKLNFIHFDQDLSDDSQLAHLIQNFSNS